MQHQARFVIPVAQVGTCAHVAKAAEQIASSQLALQKMRLRFPLLLIGLAAVCALAGFAAPAQTPSTGVASRARHSGPFVPDGLDATEVSEIDLEGLKKILQRDPKDPRPLLINFWATWCDGCREEFPDLVRIDNDYRDRGLNFISVSLDEVTEIKTTVPDFLKQMKAQMRVVLLNVKDPEPAIHAVDETWDGALPATYLFDKDGKVVFKYFGAIKPAELRSAIDKLVRGKQ
jgi:thiol-disulfide isomerase/thioredoxin